MKDNTIQSGKALGRKHFAIIAAKGERWKKRNVPIYIRESLFVPHYFVDYNGFVELYVIQPPALPSDKVHFILYARSKIDEGYCPKICDC
jgi:hypothetical protein